MLEPLPVLVIDEIKAILNDAWSGQKRFDQSTFGFVSSDGLTACVAGWKLICDFPELYETHVLSKLEAKADILGKTTSVQGKDGIGWDFISAIPLITGVTNLDYILSKWGLNSNEWTLLFHASTARIMHQFLIDLWSSGRRLQNENEVQIIKQAPYDRPLVELTYKETVFCVSQEDLSQRPLGKNIKPLFVRS